MKQVKELLLQFVQGHTTKCLYYRFIMDYPDIRYRERLVHLSLLSLSMRREIADIMILYNYLKGISELNISHHFTFYCNNSYSLRGHDSLELVVPFCRTEQFRRSFFIRVIRSWNALPFSIRVIDNASDFKMSVQNYFTSTVLPTVQVRSIFQNPPLALKCFSFCTYTYCECVRWPWPRSNTEFMIHVGHLWLPVTKAGLWAIWCKKCEIGKSASTFLWVVLNTWNHYLQLTQ